MVYSESNVFVWRVKFHGKTTSARAKVWPEGEVYDLRALKKMFQSFAIKYIK